MVSEAFLDKLEPMFDVYTTRYWVNNFAVALKFRVIHNHQEQDVHMYMSAVTQLVITVTTQCWGLFYTGIFEDFEPGYNYEAV